ncbi:hypothetical protein ACHAXR_012076 [Thalassiosira sp. AJA248-18]
MTSALVQLESNGADTKVLRIKLASLYPKLANLVQDEENLTLALNEEYVPMGEVWKLKEGDTDGMYIPAYDSPEILSHCDEMMGRSFQQKKIEHFLLLVS